ncbi:Gas vesicle protein OS=Ureibacillus acetophenoni OX=614649 GN=SAMN05877842_11831 PE=4 SV=1 [Ureibacillus acetophenoni]
MSQSKLVKSMIAGALIGAAISMFDRKSREHTIQGLKKAKDTVQYYSTHREELQQIIEHKMAQVQKLYETTQDNVSFIKDKIDEVKEIPIAVQDIMDETKTTFTKPIN